MNAPGHTPGAKVVSHPHTACQLIAETGTGMILAHDAAAPALLGIPEGNLRGRSLADILQERSPAAPTLDLEALAQQQPVFFPHHAGSPHGLYLHLLQNGDRWHITFAAGMAPREDLLRLGLEGLHTDPALTPLLGLRLYQAESRLENYMRGFPGIFFSQRPDFSFSALGAGLEERLGGPMPTLYRSGNAFLELIHENDREFFLREIAHNSRASATFSLSYRIRRPSDGSILHLMDVRTPQHAGNGLLLGHEGVWLDNTRQALAESRLGRAAWRESLAVLTNGLIHDFSNIMAGIHSLSELYHESMDTAHPMYEGMTQIRKNAREAQRLVRRIIDLNRDQTGNLGYHNLEAIIRDQLELLQIVLPRHTRLETQFTEKELPVYFDDVSFRQVLLNLAMNARDALENDGRILLEVREIPAGTRIQENTFQGAWKTDRAGIEVRFCDNGSGILPEHLGQIFTPFFTTKDGSRGSGFGLYNARLFIESCRGRIAVQSTRGQGTTFSLWIPMADFTEAGNSSEGSASHTVPLQEGRRPAVIVYSPSADPASFEIFSRLCQREWEVLPFSAQERLEGCLQSHSCHPHLFLAIGTGTETTLAPVIDTIHAQFPELPCALQLLGKEASELVPEVQKKVDLILDESIIIGDAVKRLENLLLSCGSDSPSPYPPSASHPRR